jgi:hypothetical protein
LLLILTAGVIIPAAWVWLQDTKGLPAAKGFGDVGRGQAGFAVFIATVLLVIFYTGVAPKILLAPLRESPQSGFARYYIPAIPAIERDDRTLHRYASVLPLQPANALVSGVEPLDGWANLYSSRFRQFWLAMLEPLFRNLPSERRVFGADGQPPQDHYIFLGTGRFLPNDPESGMDVDRRFHLNLLSLMNVRYVLSYYPLSSKYLVEIHAPAHPLKKMEWDQATGRPVRLRESYVGWPNFASGITSAIHGPPAPEDHVYAYRNVCALPRAFSVERVERHGADGDALKSITEASPIELTRTAHMLEADAPPDMERLAPASLRLTGYRGREIDLDATSPGRAVIVVASTWSPGWKAYVDGREARPFRVNHTQIGILLPHSGTFRVRLVYEPSYGWLSNILAVPTRLLPNSSRSEPSDLRFGSDDLPTVCASRNAEH